MTEGPSLSDFARFYAPLAATSLLLTATNPLLTAALARTNDPASALAGYSVAFALTGVLYAPLLVFQQVAAARLLVGGRMAPVRRLAVGTGVLFSLLGAAIAYRPELSGWIFEDVIGVTGRVYTEALGAMTLLWTVPLLTGIRALYQGRLVAGHDTHPIAVATGVRTAVLAVVAFVMTVVSSGAWIGAAAFTVGLLVEVVAVALASRSVSIEAEGDGDPAEEELLLFSTPLMANVLLWWTTPLIINAVLARTPEPDCALAAFAVVEAIGWFLTAPVGQLQHAGIALVDGTPAHRRIRLWAGGLALTVTLLLGLLSLPGVREWVLWQGFRLDSALRVPASNALPLVALYPLLYAHRQYYQGLFIRAGASWDVGVGALLRIVVILIAAVLLLEPLGVHGAVLGVGLAVLGLIVEGVYLERRSHHRVFPVLDGAESSLPAGARAMESR